MYTCAWVSSLCHFCVQRLLTVRAGPCRYSCLHVFKTDIDPVCRRMLCWGHILISTTVSFPNLEGLRGTLLPRWRGIALLSGCPGWKGSWLSSLISEGKLRLRHGKGLAVGQQVHSFPSLGSWFTSKRGWSSVSWNLPGICPEDGPAPHLGVTRA